MGYDLIGGQVIPAVSGGVFSYVRTVTASDALLNTPAVVLASYIIDQAIGSMTDPDNGSAWPLYTSFMPDTGANTNCGAMYDTPGFKDGRLMEGAVIQHYGIQLKIRSDTHVAGYNKADAVAVALDAIANATITIGANEYQIYNVSRASPVISLGAEPGTKGRQLFTVNFLVSLKRIT